MPFLQEENLFGGLDLSLPLSLWSFSSQMGKTRRLPLPLVPVKDLADLLWEGGREVVKSDSAISLHLEHDSSPRYGIFVNSATLVSKLLVSEGGREGGRAVRRD